MISNAIKDSGAEKPDNNRDYQKLGVEQQHDRPASPFSFMSAKNEDETFEMVDMADEKQKQRESGSTAIGSVGSPKGKSSADNSPDSMHSPEAIIETYDRDVDRRSRDMRAAPSRTKSEENTRPSHGRQQSSGLLDVPQYGPGSKPPITRFKSLREGVNRAASVSRQGSLKRLNSLKKVHTNWYRDDMAIEGHGGEAVPVY